MVNPKLNLATAFFQLFEKEIVEGGKQVLDTVLEEGKRTVDDIVTDAKEQYDAFLNDIHLADTSDADIVFQELELLNSAKLIALAKDNKVEDANEVYAWKIQKGDGVYLNLAYGKDRELLAADKNKFLVIKAEALSVDLLNMFEKSDLVILK